MTDLQALSPREIDEALAEIHGRISAAHAAWTRALHETQRIERHMTQPRSWYKPEDLQRAQTQRDEARAEFEKVDAETAPYDAEFARRGGWTRAFIVLDGHVHSSMDCSTCNNGRYATRFGWLTELSDHDEAEIVDLAGSRACTRCFPSAPVDAPPSRLFHATEIEARQARVQRAAEKAEREAKKAAKAIANPDGSTLRVKEGYPSLIETLYAAKAWLTDSQESWGRKPSDSDIMLVAEAIAAKLGTTAEVEIAAAAKRAAKRK